MKALVIENVRKTYTAIPKGLRVFLLRGAAIFIAWRLLYELVLGPLGIPDHNLIEVVLWGTHKMLAPFFSNLTVDGYSLLINGKLAVTIARECNGLELMALYVGFLFCFPIQPKRLALYAVGGVLLTIFLNMVRCAVLAAMFYHEYELADFMHHYLFKLMIYGVSFYLWMLYSKRNVVEK